MSIVSPELALSEQVIAFDLVTPHHPPMQRFPMTGRSAHMIECVEVIETVAHTGAHGLLPAMDVTKYVITTDAESANAPYCGNTSRSEMRPAPMTWLSRCFSHCLGRRWNARGDAAWRKRGFRT
jgi:hypothetical protein